MTIAAMVMLPILLSACASTRKSKAAAAPTPTSATAGTTTIVAIAPPAPASCDVSIPKMLGLPQLAGGIGEVLRRIGSRLSVGLDLNGRFPELQPQPPLLPLTDPANLDESAPPAVQAAAKIKAEEDAAPQKIMAIRYLATLGCGGCYEDVEQSLLLAMSDCTEEVRYEAVKALECRPDCGCRFCTSPSCCSEPVRKRLEELTNCDKEPSARINRVARLALACCSSKPLKVDDIPREGPTPAPAQDAGQAASILGTDATNDPVAALFSEVHMASYSTTGAQSVVMPASANNLQANGTYPNRSDGFASPSSGRVLAVVNGQQVFESQVLDLVEAKKKQLLLQGKPLPSAQALMSIELKQLIDWTLIHQMATAELTAITPAGTVPASSQAPVTTASATTPTTSTISTLTTNAISTTVPGISVLETQAWLERKLAVTSNVSPAEVMAYYQIHQKEFIIPARMRWESLTILTDKCKSAEQASQVAAFVRGRAEGQNVQAPEGFSPSMIAVEVVGWQELPHVPPRHQELLVPLQPGQVSQAFRQGNDLCLLRLLAREPSQPMPLSSVAGRITQEVLKERREAALNHFLAQARATAKIWNALETDALAR